MSPLMSGLGKGVATMERDTSDVRAESSEHPVSGTAGTVEGLRANAIGLAGAIIVGMASSGPTASLALTLAAIVGTSSYGGPIAVLVCALPMLGIALAYRRLNTSRVTCGASYTWVGGAITPYVGFMVGWTMLLGYFLGTISDVLPIGPYVLAALVPGAQHSAFAAALSGTIWLVIVTVIAYLGIQATARFQWLIAAIEYITVFAFAVVALAAVFGGNPVSASFDWSWFSWQGIGGSSGLIGGILIAVYMFSGWDTSIYVNEETKESNINPGRAVLISVLTLTFMYSFLTFAYQGAVKKDALLAHGDNALFYIVQQLAGSPWDKVMIAAVLFSIIGATQTALVSGSRIAFAMGADRTLPQALGKTHPVHKTPAVATLLFAGLALIVLWLYVLGSSSVQGAFENVISSVGLMFALFYTATGIGMAVYYRKLAARSLAKLFEFAIVPLASALFLLWVVWKSVPDLGGWTGPIMIIAYVMMGIGIVFMLVARLRGQSDYFDQAITAYEPEDDEKP
jgi:amino acid transporter